MKGVKYNLTIKLPNDKEMTVKNITMKESLFNIKVAFRENYHLDIDLSRVVGYNIVNKNKEGFKKRPRKLLRDLITLTQIIKS